MNDFNISDFSNHLSDIVTNGSIISTQNTEHCASLSLNSHILNLTNPFYDANIAMVMSKLPTLLKIKEATIIEDKLLIEYQQFFEKYLPESGTLYLSKLNLYCIFNERDDKFWYNKLKLTYNNKELKNRDIKLLKNTFCILVNDFDIGLDNTDIIKLLTISNYKSYAHEILENILLEKPFDKSTRSTIHYKLEQQLNTLHE